MRKKRLLIIAMCCLMAFSLISCGKKLKSPEDVIAKARKEITVAEADTIEVQLAAKHIKKDKALMWFITGNEYQMHRYFPMVFDVVGEEEYVFVQQHMRIVTTGIGDRLPSQSGQRETGKERIHRAAPFCFSAVIVSQER